MSTSAPHEVHVNVILCSFDLSYCFPKPSSFENKSLAWRVICEVKVNCNPDDKRKIRSRDPQVGKVLTCAICGLELSLLDDILLQFFALKISLISHGHG